MLTGDLTGLIVEKRKIRNVTRIEFLKRFASQRFWSHLDWGKESFEQGISQRFVTSTQHCAMEGTGSKFVWVIHAWSFFFITVEIYVHTCLNYALLRAFEVKAKWRVDPRRMKELNQKLQFTPRCKKYFTRTQVYFSLPCEQSLSVYRMRELARRLISLPCCRRLPFKLPWKHIILFGNAMFFHINLSDVLC